ncbi:MAG: HipA N-terminal domain-containing protein [Desulfotignum sp.]
MTGLLVFWDQKIAGTLTRHKRGKVVFQYHKDWLASDGRSISISLPCQQEKFAPGVSTAFFENLLPESRARSILAHNHRFDKKDTFAFLNRIIEETLTAIGSQLAPLLGKHEKQYGRSTVYDALYEKIQENMRSMKKIQGSRRISG